MANINKIRVKNVEYDIEDSNALKEVPSDYKTKAENDELYQAKGQYLTEETDPVFTQSPAFNITSQDISNWNNKSDFSGNYNDLTNKPDLSNFITNSVDDLVNYYLKSETYTKTEVNNLIGAIQQFHYEVVQELPQTGANNIMYLVPKATSQTQNVYDEYVYANNNWEKIGDTEIDLSNYVTTTDLNTALASYTTTTDLTTLLAGKQATITSANKLDADLVDDTNSTNKFVTSAEKTTWNGKQNTLTAGQNITILNDVISASGSVKIDGNSITENSNNEIQTVGVIDQRTGNSNKMWTGTLQQYNAIQSKDSDTFYHITDDNDPVDIRENVEVITSATATYTIAELTGNKAYKLGELTSLTISDYETFDEETIIYFSSGASVGTAISIPSGLTNLGDVPTLTTVDDTATGTCTTGKSYIIAVLNDIAIWKEY